MIFSTIFLFFLSCNYKKNKKIVFLDDKAQKNKKEIHYFPISEGFDKNGTFISKNNRYLLTVCEYLCFENKEIADFFKKYVSSETNKKATYDEIKHQYFLKKYIDSIKNKKNNLSVEEIIKNYYDQKGNDSFIKLPYFHFPVTYYEIIDLESRYKNKIVGRLYEYSGNLNNYEIERYDDFTQVFQSDTVNQFSFAYIHDSSKMRMTTHRNILYQINRHVKSYLDSTGFYGEYYPITKKRIQIPSYRLISEEEVKQNKTTNILFFLKNGL